ncbi:MAG: cysteine hydrolase [Spirochaetia bacterium]|nr:cysteine hydrolase [Spirochaetia bacterium]
MKLYKEENRKAIFNVKRNLAIITIDLQRDTLKGRKLEIPGTNKILNNLKAILSLARKKNIPIIHIVRIYLEDGSNAEPVRKKIIKAGNKILSPGDEGTEIFKEALPNENINLNCNLLLSGEPQKIRDDEIILYKPRWGAFYNTKLHKILQVKGIKSLSFMGVNFPNCPRTSIYEASERDYNVYAISDAISGIYQRGKKELESIGVQLFTAKEFIEKIN